MKILTTLLLTFLLAGCSCAVVDEESEITPTPSETPATSEETTANSSNMDSQETENDMARGNTKDYVDYLASEYNIESPEMLEDFDENVLDGYSFLLNDSTYYLVQLDPNSDHTSKWIDNINSSGQIDVDIDGLPQTMYGVINGNYALISDTGQHMDGFKDYYGAYDASNTTSDSMSEMKENQTEASYEEE